MKSLTNFIIEARENVGSLPFTRDQFKEFIGAVKGGDDEDSAWAYVQEQTTKAFGLKAWKFLYGWVEGTYWDTDADLMYDILLNIPKDRIDRVLGAGSNGTAITIGDKVCKLFHKNTPLKGDDRKFFEYCLKNDSPIFPRVYKLGKNYVVMEKVKQNTPKCILYDKILGFGGPKFEGKSLNWILSGTVNGDKKAKALFDSIEDPQVRECAEYALEAITILKKVCGIDNLSDFRLANIGEREDGAIIWFDI